MQGIVESDAAQGMRSYQEDRNAIISTAEGTILVVADGHSGDECSEYLAGEGEAICAARRFQTVAVADSLLPIWNTFRPFGTPRPIAVPRVIIGTWVKVNLSAPTVAN